MYRGEGPEREAKPPILHKRSFTNEGNKSERGPEVNDTPEQPVDLARCVAIEPGFS